MEGRALDDFLLFSVLFSVIAVCSVVNY